MKQVINDNSNLLLGIALIAKSSSGTLTELELDAELEEIDGEIEVETGEAMEVEEEVKGSGLSSSACSSFPSIVSLSSAIVTLDFLETGPTLVGEGEGALAFSRELDITRLCVKMQCAIRFRKKYILL